MHIYIYIYIYYTIELAYSLFFVRIFIDMLRFHVDLYANRCSQIPQKMLWHLISA